MAQGTEEPSEQSSSSDVEEQDIPIPKKKPRRPRRKARHAVYRGIPGFYPGMLVQASLIHSYSISDVGPPNASPDPGFGIQPDRQSNISYSREMVMYQQHHNNMALGELQGALSDVNSIPKLQTWDRRRPPLLCEVIPRRG